jgi:archaeal flagellar protein FlaJ
MNFELKNYTNKIPIVVALVIGLASFIFYPDVAIMLDILIVAGMVGAVPYIFLSYLDYGNIKSMEDQLPLFLLDLSEAQKIGMTLPDALKQVSKSNYGNLTKEIKKIDYQISWGIPTQQALDNFANKIKKSKLIGRVIRIINEAYSSGGDIARTMEATAADIASIKEAEKQRKAVTYEHMMIMYAIYYIFIGIVIGLSQTLIPLMSLNTNTGIAGSIMSFSDPCTGCEGGIYCINCSMFSVLCSMLQVQKNCYYYALFILMAVMQGIFSGLVAGQIGEGSMIAGLKHSSIMTISGFGILVFLLKAGLI